MASASISALLERVGNTGFQQDEIAFLKALNDQCSGSDSAEANQWDRVLTRCAAAKGSELYRKVRGLCVEQSERDRTALVND